MSDATAPRHFRPSPIFLGLVGVALVSGIALYAGVGADGILTFVFVSVAWVISLCIHEFAHALVAYRYGDTSVAFRGYLTLDPLRYTHVVYSIVLPLVFLLAGGIGLPGGAVFIDRRALPSRFANAAVSAAGPLANLAMVVLLAVAQAGRDGHLAFWSALAFLLFLQLTAVILNLLPVPGLDGFGIIAPYLPANVLNSVARVSGFAVLIVFVILWIPAVNRAFFGFVFGIASLLGAPDVLVGNGYNLYHFWMQR